MTGNENRPAPPVAYHTPDPRRISNARLAASILLQLLGVFTILPTCCFLSLLTQTFDRDGSSPAGTPQWWLIAVLLGLLLIFGVIEIVCSQMIRQGSQKATLVVLTMVGIQLLSVLANIAWGYVQWISLGRGHIPLMVAGMTFSGGVGIALAILEWLLFRVFQETRLRG